jgi:hypothetical protein
MSTDPVLDSQQARPRESYDVQWFRLFIARIRYDLKVCDDAASEVGYSQLLTSSTRQVSLILLYRDVRATSDSNVPSLSSHRHLILGDLRRQMTNQIYSMRPLVHSEVLELKG